MAFFTKPLKWLAGQTDFHADAPGTGPGQAAIRAQMNAAAGRGASQAYGMAASARGSSSPLALREAQRQAAFSQQAAAQQGAIASGQLEQQRLQNIMEQQRINAGIAQGNAGGILKLAGVGLGAAGLAMSDERSKNMTGVLPMPQRQEQPKQEGGLLGGLLSDERAKNLEGENRRLKAALGAGAVGAMALGTGLAPAAAAVPLIRRGMGPDQMAPHVARAPLPQQDTPALAPTEAEALAIVRAREVAKQKALERDLQAHTEDRARVGAERQQLAAMPGSGDRMAETARRVSDERAKMYPSDEDAKMQFPAGVKPVTFRYKPEAQEEFGLDDDVNVGLLAQDLEKSPEGATVVEEDPESGMKMVDTPKLTLLATAKLAEMESRLKKLEGSKRGKRS